MHKGSFEIEGAAYPATEIHLRYEIGFEISSYHVKPSILPRRRHAR